MVALHLLIYFIMNELQVFKNEEMGVDIRSEVIDGEPWFVAKDIAAALDISWTGHTLDGIPDEWRSMVNYTTFAPENGKTRNRRTTIINESAMYKLVFRSNKPEADRFVNWVVGEVLPSIRRTGTYTLPAATEMFPLYQDVLLTRYSGKRRERVLVLMEKLTPIVPSFPKGEWHIFNDDIDSLWYSKEYENMQPDTFIRLCVEAMRVLGYKVETKGIRWRILS